MRPARAPRADSPASGGPSLRIKLERALESLDQDNGRVAIRSLSLFIRQLERLSVSLGFTSLSSDAYIFKMADAAVESIRAGMKAGHDPVEESPLERRRAPGRIPADDPKPRPPLAPREEAR